MFTALLTGLSSGAGVPPVRCNLYNAIFDGLAPLYGEIIGLSGLGILLLGLLLVVLIFVSVIASRRKSIIGIIGWLLVILVVGGIVLNAAGVIVPSACG